MQFGPPKNHGLEIEICGWVLNQPLKERKSRSKLRITGYDRRKSHATESLGVWVVPAPVNFDGIVSKQEMTTERGRSLAPDRFC